MTGPDPAARDIRRWRRAHEQADMQLTCDLTAFHRKARANFLLRARRFAAEARRQAHDDGKAFYRRKAIRELDAARIAHRLIMERRPGAGENDQFKEVA